MGQYYRFVNLDKKEYLHPLDWDNGMKLMEHSWVGNSFLNAACTLLANDWAGDHVVWAGDYAEEGRFLNFFEIDSASPDDNVFSLSNHVCKKVASVEIDVNTLVDGPKSFILNLSDETFVDMRDYYNKDKWVVHLLSLLLADGNGQGGGDYFSNKDIDLVGCWAGSKISVSDNVPNHFVKITPEFIEGVIDLDLER